MSTNQFRIGGVYRQANGCIVRLERGSYADPDWALAVILNYKGRNEECSAGPRILSTGADYLGSPEVVGNRTLLPGELVNINGEWIPSPVSMTESEKTKLPRHKFWGAGEPDCPPELKASNGELHTTRCKVCGDGWRQTGNACLPDLTAEPKRAPLPHYGQQTRYEAFKGFITESGCMNGAGHRFGLGNHATQRLGDTSSPTHASAFLSNKSDPA